jgi:hypothetical protein
MQSEMARVDKVIVIDVGSPVFRRDRGHQLAVAHPEFGERRAAVGAWSRRTNAREQLALPRFI